MNRIRYSIAFITPDGRRASVVSFGVCLDDAINAIGPLRTQSGKEYYLTDEMIEAVNAVSIN